MRLIITRPHAQAVPAVQELIAQGVPALALPLIGIEPLAEPAARAAVQRAWGTLPQQRLVMFVSANAVEHFFAAAAAPYPVWPTQTLAGSTGPGTTAALIAAGVPATQVISPAADAPRLDSEALWQKLRGMPWEGAGALVVRGAGGRDWLAETLSDAGARVQFVAAYRRTLPQLEADAAALLAAASATPAAHLWHFSSSEAAHNLRLLAPAVSWAAASAWATHERIGEAARALGFGQVRVLAPGLPALLRAWRERAATDLGADPGMGLGTGFGA